MLNKKVQNFNKKNGVSIQVLDSLKVPRLGYGTQPSLLSGHIPRIVGPKYAKFHGLKDKPKIEAQWFQIDQTIDEE